MRSVIKINKIMLCKMNSYIYEYLTFCLLLESMDIIEMKHNSSYAVVKSSYSKQSHGFDC